MSVILPERLFAKAADSGPGAYGELAPELRAHLKSQIALLHHCLSERAAWGEERQPWLGRCLLRRDEPLDWVLVGIAPGYASGPGLLAALMPAILAGCASEGRGIVICRLSKEAPDQVSDEAAGELPLALSAALELIGAEQIFALNPAEFAALQEELAGQSARGRALLLGEAGLAPQMSRTVLPGRPRLLLDPDCGADSELLRWAQPGAEIVTAGPGETPGKAPAFALLSDRPQAYGVKPDLWLAPGSEAFWLWPELTVSSFRARRAGIGFLPE